MLFQSLGHKALYIQSSPYSHAGGGKLHCYHSCSGTESEKYTGTSGSSDHHQQLRWGKGLAQGHNKKDGRTGDSSWQTTGYGTNSYHLNHGRANQLAYNSYVFGLYEETRVARGNPCMHRERTYKLYAERPQVWIQTQYLLGTRQQSYQVSHCSGSSLIFHKSKLIIIFGLPNFTAKCKSLLFSASFILLYRTSLPQWNYLCMSLHLWLYVKDPLCRGHIYRKLGSKLHFRVFLHPTQCEPVADAKMPPKADWICDVATLLGGPQAPGLLHPALQALRSRKDDVGSSITPAI